MQDLICRYWKHLFEDIASKRVGVSEYCVICICICSSNYIICIHIHNRKLAWFNREVGSFGLVAV